MAAPYRQQQGAHGCLGREADSGGVLVTQAADFAPMNSGEQADPAVSLGFGIQFEFFFRNFYIGRSDLFTEGREGNAI